MKQSELFYKTKKQAPKDAKMISHKLLTKSDFVDQLIAGVYSFLPLGWRVHRKIEQIIREEMDAIGGQEVFLPALQPKNLWQETGRWNHMDPPLFKLKDRHKKDLALGPTHEEVITDLVRKRVESYKDLPFYLYQIQNKFRNEMRPTGGLLRVREFVMKDLYSFHRDEKDLIRHYKKVEKAYFKIFKRCGVKVIPVKAESGTIGGDISHEFISVKKIESGHIFNLGTKYSKAMNALFVDKDGKKKPIVMGCYGIGVGRLMTAIIELHHDKKGIIWPKEVAPFDVHLIAVGDVNKQAKKIYKDLQKKDFDVLFDDRDETAGIKLVEADLIGIPLRIVISKKTLAKRSIEMKKRNQKEGKLVKINSYVKQITR
jgi:prolyl-tRNA synthetase